MMATRFQNQKIQQRQSENLSGRMIESLQEELKEYKNVNRRLLIQNTDLKIENERLRKQTELYGCFLKTGD